MVTCGNEWLRVVTFGYVWLRVVKGVTGGYGYEKRGEVLKRPLFRKEIY